MGRKIVSAFVSEHGAKENLTINVKLVKLSFNGAPAIFTHEKLTTCRLNESTMLSVEVTGEIAAVKLPSFAIRFVEDVLLVATKGGCSTDVR